MITCSFCKASTNSEKLLDGWGRVKFEIPSIELADITFCPMHRVEAEKILVSYLLENMRSEP